MWRLKWMALIFSILIRRGVVFMRLGISRSTIQLLTIELGFSIVRPFHVTRRSLGCKGSRGSVSRVV